MQVSRRRFIQGMAGGLALLATNQLPGAGMVRPAAAAPQTDSHLAWVWQFNEDGSPEAIRDTLSRNGLGIILKTHDGDRFMSTWDSSPEAVSGPQQVARLAEFFESAGVEFHAWSVVTGLQYRDEARMCAEVLKAGARSIYLDLEPRENHNYWHGSGVDARAFGAELRRLQPDARVVVAPDARPWQLATLPMAEFARFATAVAPQLYWETFDSPDNIRLLRDYGFVVPDEGVTPELVLDMARAALAPFGLPIVPIGGGRGSAEGWRRFVRHAYRLDMPSVSVWRYGISDPGLWPLLGESRPPATRVEAPPGAAATRPETVDEPDSPPLAPEVPEEKPLPPRSGALAPDEARGVEGESPGQSAVRQPRPAESRANDSSGAEAAGDGAGAWLNLGGAVLGVAGLALAAGRAFLTHRGAAAGTAANEDPSAG